MRSQITYLNNIYGGFLTMEIMIAFSLFILFTLSVFTLSLSMQKLKIWSLSELERMRDLVYKIDRKIGLDSSSYGNDSNILSNNLFSFSQSNYVESWGRNTCNPALTFNQNNTHYFSGGVDIGAGNLSTDLEVRNYIVYLTADSSLSSAPDFFIIDTKNPSSPSIVSSLNTGPGLSSVDVAGPYVFVAQASTVNQLQIIDVHLKNSPQLLSQIKLPLPTPTTTAPFATSIFYSKGYVYLGTVKWNGAEFFIINVSNIYSPVVVGRFETNTLINDIYVRGDRAYLASSDDKQMRVLDVSDKSHPILIDSFSPSGWQTQEGKTIDYFKGQVSLGRTVGGFNVITNHEVFIFMSTSTLMSNYVSKDIPGGVYGLSVGRSNIFILTHALNKEFQVYDSTLANKIFEMSLQKSPVKMACDNSTLYFASGDSRGISILQLHE